MGLRPFHGGGVAVLLSGRGAGSPCNTYNVAWADAYLHAKFHLDPSNRLATMYRHRQTGQRSDSIGRNILQTVAQKVTVRHSGA